MHWSGCVQFLWPVVVVIETMYVLVVYRMQMRNQAAYKTRRRVPKSVETRVTGEYLGRWSQERRRANSYNIILCQDPNVAFQ